MELKYFENELIPKEIIKFYDDLANIYLKSKYDFGIKDKGNIDTTKIGRYFLNEIDIRIIEKNLDLGFLIYSSDGYKKQDEIILALDKYYILKELSEIIEVFSNEIIDTSNFIYLKDSKKINPLDLKEKFLKTIKVTIPGLLIATHRFSIRDVFKLFKKNEAVVDSNNIPITWYIDNKEYDLSFILEDLFELVYPEYSEEDDININDSKLFVGNKTNNIEKELQKEIKSNKSINLGEIIKKISTKLLETGVDIGKTYLQEYMKSNNNNNNNDRLSDKNLKENIEKNLISKKKDGISKDIEIKKNLAGNKKEITNQSQKKSYRVPKSIGNLTKLGKKFLKEYGKKKIYKYFEDVTNKKIKKEDIKTFNEILNAVNDDNDKIVKQDAIKQYKSIISSEISTIQYIYDIASKSNNVLDDVENALKYLSVKNQNDTQKVLDILGSSIKSGFVKFKWAS